MTRHYNVHTMVLILPFLLSLLDYGQSVELTISGRSIVLYGDAVTLTCNGDTGLTWSGDDSGTPSENGNVNTLTVPKLTKTTTFTCSKNSDSQTHEVKVATIAGVSSPLCKGTCEVSCVLLSDDDSKPAEVFWSSDSFNNLKKSKSNTATDGTVVTHRLEEFKYTSQETHLNITNLQKSSFYTCEFKFDAQNILSASVPALIRPTSDCDLKDCNEKSRCHSSEVVSTTKCATECKQCFTYQYIEGDFINNGQCKDDKDWCEEYLDNKKKCDDVDDNIVDYCTECGFCLELEFSASNLVLPLIIFILLCLLTVLMCYKSIEEKMSVLPKIKSNTTGRLNGVAASKEPSESI